MDLRDRKTKLQKIPENIIQDARVTECELVSEKRLREEANARSEHQSLALENLGMVALPVISAWERGASASRLVRLAV